MEEEYGQKEGKWNENNGRGEDGKRKQKNVRTKGADIRRKRLLDRQQ